MLNSVRLIVKIVNPADVVVFNKSCPHSSEPERIAYGQNLAVKMFGGGLFKQLTSSEVLAIPPHRIKDITIKSL